MANHQNTSANIGPRIFFAHGPGNVAGTLKNWEKGTEDDTIIAKTYSGQVFDIAKELSSKTLVITDGSSNYALPDNSISVEASSIGDMGNGLRYWLNMKKNAEFIARRAHDFKADVAIVSLHYGLLSLIAFRRYRIPVILDMHNTLWPLGHKPSFLKQLILKVMGILCRNRLGAAVVVSPECSRQLKTLLPNAKIFEHIPQYPDTLKDISRSNALINDSEEFRILFSGRLEKFKGVFDIVDAAEILLRQGYTQIKWVFAGTGAAESELKTEIQRRNLSSHIELKGQLCRTALTDLLIKAQATITPTCSGFSEGLAKAPLESLLAEIPALMSSVVPAADVVKKAAIIFPPSSPTAIANSVKIMIDNPSRYEALCISSKEMKYKLFSNTMSYKNSIVNALSITLKKELCEKTKELQ